MARDKDYNEWRQEQARLTKSPSAGGVQSPVNAGFGMMGTATTVGNPPTGQSKPYSGGIGVPGPSGQSKYTTENASQPPPYIQDVDMDLNFWSPFQPIWPYGPPQVTSPRAFDYPTGYNLNYIQPRMELYSLLRGMRSSWGVLATIIETRKDQLLRIPYTFQRKDKPRANSAGVKMAQEFFKRPDRIFSYSQWSRELLDDLLVIDAPTVYVQRDRKGRCLGVEVLDGATLFPLIDDAGRRPESTYEVNEQGITYLKRQPAFQQIIKGLPMIDLDSSQIMYVPMRPRPEFPLFGFAPTEQIFIEASEAVKKTLYQVNFWTEGTIPDLIVTVPKDWSTRQIAQFQAHFDAMFSGNVRLKSKVRFLPGDMKPFDIKNSSGESLWSQRDETLIRLCCYGYSVSPTPFIKQTNRSVAQNASQTAEEEGLYPLMSYWKDDWIDVILQEHLGLDDIEFVFLPTPEPDAEKQAKIHDLYVKNGTRSRNEVRAEVGLEPIDGGDIPTIEIGNAVIPVTVAAAGKALPMLGGGMGEGEGDSKGKAPAPAPGSNVPMRGPKTPTPVHKIIEILEKALGERELEAAVANAKGHLDHMSHLQLHSGNYPKGHVWFQGLNLSIENAPGSKRGERDQHGTKWEVTMPSAYGYIRGTIGADGDQLDCYIGKDPASTTVWVIDQNRVSKKKGKIKGFDEHKVGLAYSDLKTFLHDYLASHFNGDGHDRLDKVVELSMDQFKSWLKTGDLHSPIADQNVGEVVFKQKDLKKDGGGGDTVSTGTGLNWYDQSGGNPVPRGRKLKRRRKVRQGPRWLELSA